MNRQSPLALTKQELPTVGARPVLKWAGGKTQLLPEIHKRLPAELFDGPVTRYVEPFVGGGAVFFSLRSMGLSSDSILIDVNADLINLYLVVQNEPSGLLERLKELERVYLGQEEIDRASTFYNVRRRFNSRKQRVGVESACDLVFLNKTCFNGLYRLNSRGEFNVPHGRYKQPRIANPEVVLTASAALHGVELITGDYTLAKRYLTPNTFMYVDPPYRPLSVTSSFVSYSQDGFGDSNQVELAHFLDNDVSKKGALFMLSNSDPLAVDPGDRFFDDLYAGFHISRVRATRNINSKGSGRGAVSEILVTNYRTPS